METTQAQNTVAPGRGLTIIGSLNTSALYVLLHMTLTSKLPALKGNSGRPYFFYQALFDHGLYNTYFLFKNQFTNTLYMVFDRKEAYKKKVLLNNQTIIDLVTTYLSGTLVAKPKNFVVYKVPLTNPNYVYIYYNDFDKLPDTWIQELNLKVYSMESYNRNEAIHNLLGLQYAFYTLSSNRKESLAKLLNKAFNTTLKGKDIVPVMTNYQRENLTPNTFILLNDNHEPETEVHQL